MAKTKKQRLKTAYQRHLDLWKALGIVLLGLPLIAVLIIARLLSEDQYTETLYVIFVISFFTFLAGIVISVSASIRQNKADVINEHLYAVWKYKPETIYTFRRRMTRYEKRTSFWNFLAAAGAMLLLGSILLIGVPSRPLGIVTLCLSGLFLLIAVSRLPYVQYLFLRVRTAVLGDAKEVIFSRGGIWYCGKVCYFGDRGITYTRVERKDQHGFDTIVFYYTVTHGFQQTAKELSIPVPKKMAYAADDLVAEFNKSDFLNLEKRRKK
ncbi:MAG: hypothetical protein J6X30_04885 [Clostridia bacterium]|nr:hypothetical protein [Clostridia bacterium]